MSFSARRGNADNSISGAAHLEWTISEQTTTSAHDLLVASAEMKVELASWSLLLSSLLLSSLPLLSSGLLLTMLLTTLGRGGAILGLDGGERDEALVSCHRVYAQAVHGVVQVDAGPSPRGIVASTTCTSALRAASCRRRVCRVGRGGIAVRARGGLGVGVLGVALGGRGYRRARLMVGARAGSLRTIAMAIVERRRRRKSVSRRFAERDTSRVDVHCQRNAVSELLLLVQGLRRSSLVGERGTEEASSS